MEAGIRRGISAEVKRGHAAHRDRRFAVPDGFTAYARLSAAANGPPPEVLFTKIGIKIVQVIEMKIYYRIN